MRLKRGMVNNLMAMGLALVGFAVATKAAGAAARSTDMILLMGTIGAALAIYGVGRPWLHAALRKVVAAGGWLREHVRRRPAAITISAPAPSQPRVSGTDDRAQLVQRFLDQGRTAILLRAQIARTLAPDHVSVVKDALQETMAFVEGGPVLLGEWTLEECDQFPGQSARRREEIAAFYFDRYPVTNRQFRGFLADGGYGQQSLWDAGIWSRISEFVDRTGFTGPRFWENGTYPPEEDDLPVVGVSWYEADAYARWVGRRLPTDAEWVKAAACPMASSGADPVQRRFPWGDTPDARRANLWITGIGRPTFVRQFAQGASAAGAHQMIGNVWEWTASDVQVTSYGRDVRFGIPLKSMRGGAFDTYFENQATCQLHSGDSPLARRHNIGFRCALSASDIVEMTPPAS